MLGSLLRDDGAVVMESCLPACTYILPVIGYGLLHILVRLGKMKLVGNLVKLCLAHKLYGGLTATASCHTILDLAVHTKDPSMTDLILTYLKEVPVVTIQSRWSPLVQSLSRHLPEL